MIIWFGGGLGNQMFHYAMYKAAEEKGYDVKADLSWFKTDHNYGADIESFKLKKLFNIDLNECTEDELNKYNNPRDLIDRVLNKLNINYRSFNKLKIKESKSKYINNLLDYENCNKYLYGYWQSEDYFKFCEKTIRDTFKFPKLDEYNNKISEDMKENISVSLHVRRKSYLSSAAAALYENLSEKDYYNKAISKITELIGNDIKLYLFTDDVEWCKQNLILHREPFIVENNRGEDSYKDMQLMGCCKHNIIANSSFSWWGAWLNNNPNKIVVGPTSWFEKKSGFKDDMIIPDNWIKL